MAKRQTTRKAIDLLSPQGESYSHRVQRPLHCLVFVLPFLIAFELGVLWRHTVEPGRPLPSLVAWRVIGQFVELLGASGFYFPGLALVVILLACHVVAKHRWSIEWPTLLGMLGESVVWAIPLCAFNTVVYQARTGGVEARWLDDVILSLGAGIYEELVFRLIAITLLSILFVDVLSLNKQVAIVIVIAASALLFSAHHHPPFGDEPFQTSRFFFRTVAGVYLAGIFVFRGFGIAAGTHAFYDIAVVTIAAVRSAEGSAF